MNKIHTLYQLNQRFSLSISVWWDLPIVLWCWYSLNVRAIGMPITRPPRPSSTTEWPIMLSCIRPLGSSYFLSKSNLLGSLDILKQAPATSPSSQYSFELYLGAHANTSSPAVPTEAPKKLRGPSGVLTSILLQVTYRGFRRMNNYEAFDFNPNWTEGMNQPFNPNTCRSTLPPSKSHWYTLPASCPGAPT